jgi:hypothetical protein
MNGPNDSPAALITTVWLLALLLLGWSPWSAGPGSARAN